MTIIELREKRAKLWDTMEGFLGLFNLTQNLSAQLYPQTPAVLP